MRSPILTLSPSSIPRPRSNGRTGSIRWLLVNGSQAVSQGLWRCRQMEPSFFVGDASLNTVAVFDAEHATRAGILFSDSWLEPLGFIPTDWYPSALAVRGDDLLIATAKGVKGARANKDMGKTSYEMRHRDHPYIPTPLIKGSIALASIFHRLSKNFRS